MITRVTRGREVQFNPVQYEHVKAFATVTYEWGTDDGDPPDTDSLTSQMDEEIDILLQPELDAVAKVTTNPASIIHEYRYTETDER